MLYDDNVLEHTFLERGLKLFRVSLRFVFSAAYHVNSAVFEQECRAAMLNRASRIIRHAETTRYGVMTPLSLGVYSGAPALTAEKVRRPP